ncbi:EamA family transporter [Candidatus Woesearchaeota archaeon]|nr:EamA family transporter [Candidatus Woesearchaeota archaeon]
MTNLLIIAVVIIATVIGACGSLYFKKASDRVTKRFFANFLNADLMKGVALYLISSIIFILALQYEKVSILYPITSLSYIWASLLAIKYLGEKPNTLRWIGIVIIIIGVTFIGLS